MQQNLNKKEVQMLLKEKELRNTLLNSLLYFQKKLFTQDQYLEDIIEKIKKEKIKRTPLQTEEIDANLTTFTEELLIFYPDIKENYEFIKTQRRKTKTERVSKSYGKTILDNMIFTKTELEKRVGLRSPYERNDFVGGTTPTSNTLTKSQDIVDDNERFLQDLESLTKNKPKNIVKVDIESFDKLLGILKGLNINLLKEELEKVVNSIVNNKFHLRDDKINKSLTEALELLN